MSPRDEPCTRDKEIVIYPVIFRVGTFEVTSFGVMVGVGALVGIWLFMRELAFARISPSAVDAALVGVIGGLAGAKMLWVFEHVGEEPIWTLILSRGGMSLTSSKFASNVLFRR